MSRRLLAIPLALSAVALVGAGCGGQQAGAGPPPQPPQGPQPVAEVTHLSGESTAVTLDSEFTDALEKLEVTPGPVGDAKISEKGVASFPITGGDVTYYEPGSTSPFVRGEIMHDGSGLSLTAGDTEVELTDFVVNPANSKLTAKVSANGEVAAEDAELFFLNGSTLEPLETKGDQAILKGTEVTLTEDAAKLLNKTFEVDAFEKGLPIGKAKITLNTQ
jgi:hypothetical protein